MDTVKIFARAQRFQRKPMLPDLLIPCPGLLLVNAQHNLVNT